MLLRMACDDRCLLDAIGCVLGHGLEGKHRGGPLLLLGLLPGLVGVVAPYDVFPL